MSNGIFQNSKIFFGILNDFLEFPEILEFSNDFLEILEILESRNRKFKLHRRHWGLGYRLRRELSQRPGQSLEQAASPNRKYDHSKKNTKNGMDFPKMFIFCNFQVFGIRKFPQNLAATPRRRLQVHYSTNVSARKNCQTANSSRKCRTGFSKIPKYFLEFWVIFWNFQKFWNYLMFFWKFWNFWNLEIENPNRTDGTEVSGIPWDEYCRNAHGALSSWRPRQIENMSIPKKSLFFWNFSEFWVIFWNFQKFWNYLMFFWKFWNFWNLEIENPNRTDGTEVSGIPWDEYCRNAHGALSSWRPRQIENMSIPKKSLFFWNFKFFWNGFSKKSIFLEFSGFFGIRNFSKNMTPRHGDDSICTIPLMYGPEKTARLQIPLENSELVFPKFQNVFWNLTGFLEFDRFFGILRFFGMAEKSVTRSACNSQSRPPARGPTHCHQPSGGFPASKIKFSKIFQNISKKSVFFWNCHFGNSKILEILGKSSEKSWEISSPDRCRSILHAETHTAHALRALSSKKIVPKNSKKRRSFLSCSHCRAKT